jgi:diketogulonate reductase-like aldo/keto reductase
MSMQELSLGSTVVLEGGVPMPRFGLGVWQCPGHVATRAVVAALGAGYRHIDTARIYGNEAEVAKGIRDSGVPREEVFVTTKLWTADHGYDQALKAFDESEKRLGIGVVDQFLSHFPVAGRRVDAWRALVELKRTGRCRSIGVSNYTERHLQELIDQTGVAPEVNQVEFHPFLNQKGLLAFCKQHKIQVVAYSPLTHGKRLDDPRLAAIAERLRKSPAQVLIRWALQMDLVVIPKSSRPERIAENAAVFDFRLSDADLRAMDAWHENLRTCWDPTDEP